MNRLANLWWMCLAVVVSAVASPVANAQNGPTYTRWNFKEHAFGDVREVDSVAVVRYVFTNTASHPIQLTDVRVSCGCTTPAWTKRAVPPGDTGSVFASYGAWGRPGPFQKSVTVFVNPVANVDEQGQAANPDIQEIAVLRFEGNVIAKPSSIHDFYPMLDGGLRLSSNTARLGRVAKHATATDTLTLFNTSLKPIQIQSFESAGPHLTFSLLEPEKTNLQPNDSVHVLVRLDASQQNDWDLVNFSAIMTTSDPLAPRKALYAQANIFQDFGNLTEAQRAAAPKARFSNTSHNFGQVPRSQPLETSFIITNDGQTPLVIHQVKPNDATVVAEITATSIAPGQSATLKAKADISRAPGTVYNRNIMLITNDPANPNPRFALRAQLPAEQ